VLAFGNKFVHGAEIVAKGASTCIARAAMGHRVRPDENHTALAMASSVEKDAESAKNPRQRSDGRGHRRATGD